MSSRQLAEQRDVLLAEGEDDEETVEGAEQAPAVKGEEEHSEMTNDKDNAIGTTSKVSPVTKKRKLLDADAVDGEMKKQKQAERPVPETDDADDPVPASPTAASDAMQQQDHPSPMSFRVPRTSVPSSKYLDGTMQEAREYSAVAVSARPVLRPSLAANGGGGGHSKRSPTLHPDVEFEKQLRDSLRIDREVGRRSLAMTRKRQLPRLPAPLRRETHWDLLLQEMKWMAADFSHERNWKRVMQFHLAKDVVTAQNAERVRQEREGRQVAREVALQVSAFWRTIERIAARSRVRFEEADVPSKRGDSGGAELVGASGSKSTENPTDTRTIETIEEPSKDKLMANGDGAEDGFILRLKKIEVASRLGDGENNEAILHQARGRLKSVMSAGKRARDAMSASSTGNDKLSDGSTEHAWSEFQRRLGSTSTHPATLLATFQVLAIRWMLEMYSAGVNMFLNDQLGLGKAATIVAFLSVLELLSTTTPSPLKTSSSRGPHLIIVSDQELHKWRYYLRLWHPDKYIQLYDTSKRSPNERRRLRREWRRKLSHDATDSGQFLEDEDRRNDEWEDDETNGAAVFCVLCPVRAFVKDADEFTAFENWQMLIVENEHDDRFVNVDTCRAINKIQQQQRRVMCNGHPFESWRSSAEVRALYGQFLLDDGAGDEVRWSDVVTVDKPSIAQALQRIVGQTASTRVSSWEQDEDDASISPHWIVLTCVSLRRVRSEVESQLGKVEEISLSCPTLTASQSAQYRSAIIGFATALNSNREERLEAWLRLLLRLRTICNCVDVINDFEKLAQADIELLKSSSTKLVALESLLSRLVRKEGKKVVIYTQCDAMCPILEVFLSLLDISFVRITGSTGDQRRALCHFADRRAVSVALASTRLSSGDERRAACVYGAEAVIVLDSDWSAVCDAKLRASWARMTTASDTLPVYRVHCENTLEESLLRAGASLSEKLFGEMTPQELLVVPPDLLVGSAISSSALEKPSWWSSRASASASATSIMANLSKEAFAAEKAEKYGGDATELSRPLVVYGVELDAEEHLLLASTDELTPVEWYAVNYVHGLTNKGRRGDEGDATDDEIADPDGIGGWSDAAMYEPSFRSFDEFATTETNQWWQDGDAEKNLYFSLEDDDRTPFVKNGAVNESLVEKLMNQLRRKGMEAHYSTYAPPNLASDASNAGALTVLDPGSVDANQMLFRVSYREPAPPASTPVLPASLPGRQKTDADFALAHKQGKKKQRLNALGAGTKGSGHGSGVKRKLDQQSGFSKSGAGGLTSSTSGGVKEQRVDLDGIPLPELEDDDFWGDTNLDALDSASWDDAGVLTGILGPAGMDFGSEGGAFGLDTGGNTNATAGTSGPGSAGAAGVARGSSASVGKSGLSSKKSKGAGASSGRARKGSMSTDPSGGGTGRSGDSWSAVDDLVLKKLFELYGSNWSLIAQVFNSSTSVSRYFSRKRTPRQCYDRYGKIISGSLVPSSTASSGSTAAGSTSANSKDGKAAAAAAGSTMKQQKAAAAAAVVWTPAVLDERIGVPPSELLVSFALRNSMPGVPPPSIVNAPSLAEMSLKKKLQKQQQSQASGKSSNSHDDLKSIKNSFDAIILCMKRKATPTSTSTTPASGMAALSSSTVNDENSKHATHSSLSPSLAASTSKALKAMTAAASGTASKPHKSHLDMVSLLPNAVLGPDEVIKRSKEAAVVAVQAAAAVASVGGSGGSNEMMLSGSPSGFAGGGLLSRRAHAASLTPASGSSNSAGIAASGAAAAVTPTRLSTSMGMASGHTLPPTVPVSSKLPTSSAISGASPSSWGQNSVVHNVVMANSPMGMGVVVSPTMTHAVSSSASGSGRPMAQMTSPQAAQPVPVTTSTLLHVLDRMPEIKHKIQSILNRTDCSEAQKVAMIARLLSNSNAIASATASAGSGTIVAPPASGQSPQSVQVLQPTASLLSSPMAPVTAAALHSPHLGMDATSATSDSDAVLSSLTADSSLMNAAMLIEPTEAPLPLPASLASPDASPTPEGDFGSSGA